MLLDSRSGIRKGGESGPAVVPSDVEQSILVAAIQHKSFEMPPKSKLADSVIADFIKWIEICLLARKMAEAGVRFIEISQGGWDYHNNLPDQMPKSAANIDKPIAGLIADLKQRGLWNETLLIWGGEFGRTPAIEDMNDKVFGRDHNGAGFTYWIAGGGVKGGIRYGATDELGWMATENKVHARDLHATILHLLGLDHKRLSFRYGGRDYTPTDVDGEVVQGILC